MKGFDRFLYSIMHTCCVLVACGPELVSKHCALRPQKRGGLLGTETGVGAWVGGERVKARPLAPTRKTEEAVDRRQNNQNVKAVLPRHCVASSVYAIAVSTAVWSMVLNEWQKPFITCV